MTLTARDVATSVFGAYRLARFDPAGLQFIDRTPEGALKSFYAAVLVLPAYALLLAIRLIDQGIEAPLMQVVLVEGIAYVVNWTAFPLALHRVAALLDRSGRYSGAVAANNWAAVVQMGAYLPAVVLSKIGLLPDGVGSALVFGVMLAMMTYQWFVLRTALEVNGPTAAALVMLDLFLSALIGDFADNLL
ncbi:hypothetical protein [Azospirillum sp.]|uniref:hypothetical protein n=1 Tax=Azospirillum sp. TaxID=34012 RepID=UPI003D761B5E